MTIYFLLIGFILCLPVLLSYVYKDQKKINDKTAFWSVLAIFLVFALKKETVGYDIAGYRLEYLLSAKVPWSNFDYVYFEKGYIFLQKLFSKADVPFQLFEAVIYAVICIGLYLFIKKFSKNASLSALIFITYQFFLFNITGLRQALAMGICMFAFSLLDFSPERAKTSKAKRLVIAAVLIYLASLFHESAMISFLIILMYIFTARSKTIGYAPYILLLIMSYFLQPIALRVIQSFFRYSSGAEVSLGMNFLFLLIIAAFTIFCYHRGTKKSDLCENDKQTIADNKVHEWFIRIMLVSLSLYVMLSGDTLLRATMYLTMFLIPALPNAICKFNERSRIICNIAAGVFLILFFYLDALAPATFDIVPYAFFWQ